MGARPLRRVIEQQIRDKVTDYYLDHLDVQHLEAVMEDGQLVIKERQAETKEGKDEEEKKDDDKD